MKYLILLCSILSISALRADTTQTVQDDLLKERNEVLKCPPVVASAVAVEIKPELAVQTELVGEKKIEEKVAEELEVELLPTKNLSTAERLKVYRTKLEEKNLVLLEKKLEMIRLQQEMALLRNLENSMNQTLKNIEKL
ncbi:hypothetical protein SHI21_20515 [Bacteriovorax sp. PP10]|uniref:Uncharacterized protein n=1 Tax=Bacteriovorax antarcticus TaxID=3088717 RepID=A0ABU5VZY9_9BACT|nr:hypothetical protein [Bacteriovorax sp. PP10]MEA9358633.1 hypothetical protein [Bacteriovorax sp. PP10]